MTPDFSSMEAMKMKRGMAARRYWVMLFQTRWGTKAKASGLQSQAMKTTESPPTKKARG